MAQNLKGGISRTSKIVAVLAVTSVGHRFEFGVRSFDRSWFTRSSRPSRAISVTIAARPWPIDLGSGGAARGLVLARRRWSYLNAPRARRAGGNVVVPGEIERLVDAVSGVPIRAPPVGRRSVSSFCRLRQ
jgi:hypothetical protein